MRADIIVSEVVGVGGSECSQGWSLQHLGFPFGQVSVVAVEERGECFVILYFFFVFFCI